MKSKYWKNPYPVITDTWKVISKSRQKRQKELESCLVSEKLFLNNFVVWFIWRFLLFELAFLLVLIPHAAFVVSRLQCFSLCRKTRYVRHDKLDWEIHSSMGHYVRKQCKPLRVSLSFKFIWSNSFVFWSV